MSSADALENEVPQNRSALPSSSDVSDGFL